MLYKVIDNFYDIATCNELLQKYEDTGFLDEPLEFGDNVYARYDFRDNDLSCQIQQRLPNELDISFVNNLFYVSKYFIGNFINYHFDGHKCDRDITGGPMKSKYTILIYLNDNFVGGNTVLKIGDEIIHIKPKIGRCLILDQDTWHSGAVIDDGCKYILRGDLF